MKINRNTSYVLITNKDIDVERTFKVSDSLIIYED